MKRRAPVLIVVVIAVVAVWLVTSGIIDRQDKRLTSDFPRSVEPQQSFPAAGPERDEIVTEGNLPAQTWEQLTVKAVQKMKSGNNAEAQRFCSEAMKMVSQGGPGDMRLAKTHMLMGEIHRWGKKFDLAEESYRNAVASCEKVVGPNHPDMAIPLDAMANFYYFTLARYDLVAPLYQRILSIVANQPSRDDREVAMRAKNLAEVYQLQKQYEKAEPLYKQAIALSEKTNDDIPNYLLTLAEFYRLWGKCEQAEPPAKRAMMIREKVATPDAGQDAQLDLAVCLDSLARIYITCGRPDEAEILYSRSIAIVESISSADNPDLVPRLVGLAEALRGQRKFEQADTQYKTALVIAEKHFGIDVPEIAEILEKYAVLLNDMNRSGESKFKLDRAEQIRKNTSTE